MGPHDEAPSDLIGGLSAKIFSNYVQALMLEVSVTSKTMYHDGFEGSGIFNCLALKAMQAQAMASGLYRTKTFVLRESDM